MIVKRSIRITGGNCNIKAEEMSWKKTGFKNFNDIKEKVRDMPLEERVNLLTEIFIDDMAKKHFSRKMEFLRKLGKQTWVEEDEIYEWAKKIYTDLEETEFEIDKLYFDSTFINPQNVKFETFSSYTRNIYKKERNE